MRIQQKREHYYQLAISFDFLNFFFSCKIACETDGLTLTIFGITCFETKMSGKSAVERVKWMEKKEQNKWSIQFNCMRENERNKNVLMLL